MYIGSNTIQDNLAFGYDSYYGGVQCKSTRFYKGQPTTNVLATNTGARNARFEANNNWGTYNTNQYNSNNYFDIGTIGSVSNNIVTLSSVGHNIRSFDVLRPQTTGGGVGSGTNYVVKKLSSTTFSLHAYNSSQNGTQGYINPDTNFFKVHDAYANDTRVSINATNFPDMWWGPPHLPNSGIIKELRYGGGYVRGTNALRLHIYRGDGVADGMAYNVNTPVTQGDVITVSYWVKPVNANAYGKTYQYTTYFGAGNGAFSNTVTLNSTGDWQKVEHQWTASATYPFIQYWFPQGSTDKYAFDMADLQVELNKGHATPFTTSSRSTTNSLIDLKRTTTIDINNVSFDSSGQPDWDGTDDKGIINNFPHVWNNSVTIEAVVMWHDNTRSVILGNYNQGAGGHDINIEKLTSGNLRFYWDRGARDVTSSNNVVTTNGSKYHHVIWMRDEANDNFKFYVDGALVTTVSNAGSGIPSTGSTFRFGADSRDGATVHNGAIPILKVYDIALSTEQVQQNFKAYKSRFNI